MTERASPPSVLVVDDESGILQTLEILLRAEGFVPHVAHGGKARAVPQMRDHAAPERSGTESLHDVLVGQPVVAKSPQS